MIRIIFLAHLAFLAICSSASAQKISYNPVLKIKDGYHQHYLGSDGKNEYIIASNRSMKKDYVVTRMANAKYIGKQAAIKVIVCDLNFQFQRELPINFAPEIGSLIDAYIHNGDIVTLFTSPSIASEVYIRSFSTEDGTIKAPESNRPDVTIFGGKSIKTIRSIEKNYTALYTRSEIVLLDRNHKPIWIPVFPFKSISSVNLLPDGTIYIIGNDEKKTTLVKYKIKTKVESQMQIAAKPRGFHLVPSSSPDEIYALSQYSNFEERDIRYYYGNGIDVVILDVEQMKIKSEYRIKYGDEALLSLSEKKNLEKIKGIKFMKISNGFVGEDGELIIIVQKHESIEGTSYDIRTKTYVDDAEDYGNIIVIRSNGPESYIQKVIEVECRGPSALDFLLNTLSKYKNDSIYLIHNEGRHKYELKCTVLSKNLQFVNSTSTNSHKIPGLYFGVRDAVKLDATRYLMLGKFGKKSGSLVVDFK